MVYNLIFSLGALIFQLVLIPVQALLTVIGLTCARHRRARNQDPKAIIITGANSGLGEALALHYAKPGVVLGITGRRREPLEAVAKLCKQKGADVVLGVLDVADQAAMEEWITAFDKRHTTDLVIANAGISEGTAGLGQDLVASTRAVFRTNVDGVFNTILPLLPAMKQRRSGQIALMASLAGFGPLPTSVAYSSSKACIKTYGEALRAMVARDNVDVTVICPGFVKSPMTDINTMPMPFMVPLDVAVAAITKGIQANLPIIAFPWQLTLVRLAEAWLMPLAKDVLARSGLVAPIAYFRARRNKGSSSDTETKSRD